MNKPTSYQKLLALTVRRYIFGGMHFGVPSRSRQCHAAVNCFQNRRRLLGPAKPVSGGASSGASRLAESPPTEMNNRSPSDAALNDAKFSTRSPVETNQPHGPPTPSEWLYSMYCRKPAAIGCKAGWKNVKNNWSLALQLRSYQGKLSKRRSRRTVSRRPEKSISCLNAGDNGDRVSKMTIA